MMEESFQPRREPDRDWEEVAWIEVWFDPATPANYIYLMRQLFDGTLEIVDPHRQKRAATFHKYVEASAELVGNKCVRIEGRICQAEAGKQGTPSLPRREPDRDWAEVAWAEVWFDSSDPANYLYILRQLVDGTYEIVDPQRGRIGGTFPTYEDANIELVDDECVRAEGRSFNEEDV